MNICYMCRCLFLMVKMSILRRITGFFPSKSTNDNVKINVNVDVNTDDTVDNSVIQNTVMKPITKQKEVKNTHLPKFVCQLSNDDFSCLSIVKKSDDGAYLCDDAIDLLLEDLAKCIAFDDSNNRYFIKKITPEQIIPEVMYETDAKKYLSRFEVKYNNDNSKQCSTTIWNIVSRHMINSCIMYNGITFYNPNIDPEKKIFNVFYRWKYNPVNEVNEVLIKPYKNLCKKCIFTDRNVMIHFHKWVANILQHPGIRNEFGFLLIGKPGTGKTTLINFIAELTRGYSKENIDDLNTLFGEFNDGRENIVFIGVNDLYHSKKSINECWSVLKSPITERVFECKCKYQATRTVENVNNIIVSTNNDFVDTEMFDRRWQVIRLPNDKQPKLFFEEVYKMLRDEVAMSHLFTWYLQMSLDDYENEIIASENSLESGYARFVKWYLNNVAKMLLSKEHLAKYWDKYEEYENEIINIRIGILGEPITSIYAQFREWSLSNMICVDKIPDLNSFKRGIYKFMDVIKPSKFVSRNKTKVDVVHLKLVD